MSNKCSVLNVKHHLDGTYDRLIHITASVLCIETVAFVVVIATNNIPVSLVYDLLSERAGLTTKIRNMIYDCVIMRYTIRSIAWLMTLISSLIFS